MYHFKVLVLSKKGQSVDEQLKPFGPDIKNQEIVIKTKKTLIEEEKENLEKIIKLYKKYIADEILNLHTMELVTKLENILNSDDETIYKYAIQEYDKNLISKSGGLISYENSYLRWNYYIKNSPYSKILVVKDKNNPGKFIHVNSANVKDIQWNFIKYGSINTDVIVMPDGSWHETKSGEIISVSKDTKRNF